jgi:GR25 family glycosyltransferase involved in LPS biosynthesis
MKTYVINLEKSIDKFNKQKPKLETMGLEIERFNAINAIEDEHLNYKDNITKIALFFTPKSVIGCALSHILLAKHILLNDNDKPYVLIMEDDALPIELDKQTLLNNINDTVKTINILDPAWDIIQLHSDACYPCPNSYTTHPLCGSTAAYLISNRGAEKMRDLKVMSHIDMHTSASIKFKKYRTKNNLFWTDENMSLNRIDTNNILLKLKSIILTKLIPLRGEKIWEHFLNFKVLRIPGINKEFTGNQLINYFIALLIFRKLNLLK